MAGLQRKNHTTVLLHKSGVRGKLQHWREYIAELLENEIPRTENISYDEKKAGLEIAN